MKILRIAVAAAALTAGVVAGVTALPTPAEAATPVPIQYVTQTIYPAPFPDYGGYLIGTVACPAGTFVVSASADHGELGSLSPIRNSRTSPNLANNTAVLVTGRGIADYTGGTKYLNVTAGCAPAARLSGAVSRQVVLAPSTQSERHVVVICPSGTRAFGGGAYTLGPDNHYSFDGPKMVTNAVTSDGTGWSFTGFLGSPPYPDTRDRLIVTTQCAPLAGSYRSQSPAVAAPVPPNTFGTFPNTAATCFSGYTALSGGVTWSPDSNGFGVVVRQTTTFNTPGRSSGTYVEGYNTVGSLLIARTVCVPPTGF